MEDIMSLTFRNIKKWFLMITGKSVFHVNQCLGEFFKPGTISGYFNSMIEKVTKQPQFLEKGLLPVYTNKNGDKVVFPVSVIQYGLGSYDLYLKTHNHIYLEKFIECSNWILSKQEENGGIKNFIDEYPNYPYGSMCQGEAASLFVRAYLETKNDVFLDAAKRSLDFMILDVKKGGTCLFDKVNNFIVLLEYTHLEPVLNGWIFSLFGLYDFLIIQENAKFREVLDETISSLSSMLPRFDGKYWSIYDLSGKIASPFYHRLHIAQLKALFMITNNDIFIKYAIKWEKEEKNIFKKTKAFIKKAIQKIRE